MNFINRHFFVVGLSLFTAISYADEDEGLWDLDLGEILDIKVSVASSFAETDLESGSTVALVENKQWEKYGAKTVTEAIGHLPGTFIAPTLWGGSVIPIRGYASNLSVRGIATVLDGVPMNVSQTGTALYGVRSFLPDALNRIEMIRGPGSALYGSDAFHGVLSLRTYQSDEDSVSVKGTVGTEGLYQFTGNLSKSISDTIGIDFSASAIEQGERDTPYTYTIPTTVNQAQGFRADTYDAFNVFFKVNAQFGEDTKGDIGIYVLGSETEGAPSAGRGISTTGLSLIQDRDTSDGVNDKQVFRANFETQLPNDITFQGKTFYWTDETEFTTNIVLPVGIQLIPAYTLAEIEESLFGLDLLIKQAENEFNTQWALGFSYKESEIEDDRTAIFSADDAVLQPFSPGFSDGFSRDVQSIILEARSKFIEETFHILYGGRYDKYSDFGNQTTPRLGLVYLQDNYSVKALFGEAFRAPIAAELRGAGQILGEPDLEPEVIETLELVYMYKFEQWKVNFTYFMSEWTNGIVNIPQTAVPGFTTTYANVGENEADGFELSLNGTYEAWIFDLSMSYVQSEAVTAAGSIDYVSFPEYIINLNLGYDFVEQDMSLFITNRIHLEAKESPVSAAVPAPLDIDDFFGTNVNLHWNASEQLVLSFTIVNLFDESPTVPSVWGAENGLEDNDLQQRFQLDLKYTF